MMKTRKVVQRSVRTVRSVGKYGNIRVSMRKMLLTLPWLTSVRKASDERQKHGGASEAGHRRQVAVTACAHQAKHARARCTSETSCNRASEASETVGGMVKMLVHMRKMLLTLVTVKCVRRSVRSSSERAWERQTVHAWISQRQQRRRGRQRRQRCGRTGPGWGSGQRQHARPSAVPAARVAPQARVWAWSRMVAA
jgi:hypothetical protein